MALFFVSDYSDVANLFALHQGCSPACGVVWEEGEYGFVLISLSHLTDLARLFFCQKSIHTMAVMPFTRARHILLIPACTNLFQKDFPKLVLNENTRCDSSPAIQVGNFSTTRKYPGGHAN